MNTFFAYIKRIVTQACVCFTLFVLCLCLLAVTLPDGKGVISVDRIPFLFLFSAFLALSNLLLALERLAIPLRILLHYLACGVTFYIVFIVIALHTSQMSTILALLLFYTLIYAVAIGIYLFLCANRQSRGEGAEQGE